MGADPVSYTHLDVYKRQVYIDCVDVDFPDRIQLSGRKIYGTGSISVSYTHLQKKAFLAGEPGVNISVHFHKKVASGLFGGEGFILQKVSGNGIVFAEFDGHVVEYELQPGQQIVIDSGYLAAMSVTCQMDIQTCLLYTSRCV